MIFATLDSKSVLKGTCMYDQIDVTIYCRSCDRRTWCRCGGFDRADLPSFSGSVLRYRYGLHNRPSQPASAAAVSSNPCKVQLPGLGGVSGFVSSTIFLAGCGEGRKIQLGQLPLHDKAHKPRPPKARQRKADAVASPDHFSS